MTEGSAPQYQGANGEDEVNAWGIGLLLFAALLMLLGGALQAFIGLVAMFSDQILIPVRRYLFEFDHTSWGWVHLVLGVVVAGAGAGLLAGRTWGRMVAIVLALCNAVVMFAFLPQYPAGGTDHHRREHRRDLGGHDHQPLIFTTWYMSDGDSAGHYRQPTRRGDMPSCEDSAWGNAGAPCRRLSTAEALAGPDD